MPYRLNARLWTPALFVAAIASPPSVTLADDDRKVTICHVPRGNPNARHSISVGERAVDNHLDHGDHLGQCRGGRVGRANGDDDVRRGRAGEGHVLEDDGRAGRASGGKGVGRADRDARREDDGDGYGYGKRSAEWRRELAKARAERDRDLEKARAKADRERDRRKAERQYREKRQAILDRYYERVEDIDD